MRAQARRNKKVQDGKIGKMTERNKARQEGRKEDSRVDRKEIRMDGGQEERRRGSKEGRKGWIEGRLWRIQDGRQDNRYNSTRAKSRKKEKK